MAIVILIPILILTCCSTENKILARDDIQIDFDCTTKTMPLTNASLPAIAARNTTLIPILTYHRINQDEEAYNGMAISPTKFRAHLQFLVDNDFTPISLNDYHNAKLNLFILPAKPVVITFDDGWKSQYNHAVPILKEFGFPATFYIYTAIVGSKCAMTWDQIREVQELGFEIGSHSATHPKLTKKFDFEDGTRYSQRLKREIHKAKTSIENKINAPVNHFCYPYGYYDTNIVAFLENAGFQTSTSVNPASNSLYTPAHMLNRMIIGPYTSNNAIKDYLTLGEVKIHAIVPGNGVYCNNNTKAIKLILDQEFSSKIQKVRFKFNWKWKECEWNPETGMVKCSFAKNLPVGLYSLQVHAWDTNDQHYVYCWQFHQKEAPKLSAL